MPKVIPVVEAVEKFLSFCRARNDSPNTLRAYRTTLGQFVAAIGQKHVSELDRKSIRRFLFGLDAGLARSTVITRLACVRSFCNWLVVERYVNINPAEGIAGPRRHQILPDVPSEADMKRLLDGRLHTPCPSRDRLILELLYSCGLRASEVTSINVEDFADVETLLVHGKGRKDRLVPVGQYAQRAAKRWLSRRRSLLKKSGMQTSALFFSVGPRGSVERLNVRTVGRLVKSAALSKKLPPYHPHLLRHACATHMHDHGAPLQAVATMLGHARLTTTQLYTRVSPGRMLDVFRRAHPHAK